MSITCEKVWGEMSQLPPRLRVVFLGQKSQFVCDLKQPLEQMVRVLMPALQLAMRTLRWMEHYLKGPGGSPPDSTINLSAVVAVAAADGGAALVAEE